MIWEESTDVDDNTIYESDASFGDTDYDPYRWEIIPSMTANRIVFAIYRTATDLFDHDPYDTTFATPDEAKAWVEDKDAELCRDLADGEPIDDDADEPVDF